MKPVLNPPNPFDSYHCEYFEGIETSAKLEVYEDSSRSILSRNDSPDLGFRWSLNPYRGCTHACAYCYARPSHEYLGFGAGSDFETKITVKKNAPGLLHEAFMKPSWKGEMIVFSGDTDCYQPLEASYKLTQQCLEVCLEFGNPVGMITKSFLIARDLELLKKINERTRLWIVVSIPFYDEKTARMIEPGAASVANRFEALRRLSEAGIRTSVSLAPIIPGINDSDIPKILKHAAECGVTGAFMSMLRLPTTVKDVFLGRLKTLFPLAYDKIVGRIREAREGNLYQSDFGKRHKGSGDYWENIEKMFQLSCQKYGLNREEPHAKRPPFKRPSAQMEFLLEMNGIDL